MGSALAAKKRKSSTGSLESLDALNGISLNEVLSDSGGESDAESLEEPTGSSYSSDDEEDESSSFGPNGANYRVVEGADGSERYEYAEIDPVYDSDDSDAREQPNTIGNIPLSFYDSYPHIGYDINGKKIMRPATGEALDALLDSIEVPKGWTGLTDPQTGKPLNLSQDELELLRRLQMGEVPEEGFDPYPVRFFNVIRQLSASTNCLARKWFLISVA